MKYDFQDYSRVFACFSVLAFDKSAFAGFGIYRGFETHILSFCFFGC